MAHRKEAGLGGQMTDSWGRGREWPRRQVKAFSFSRMPTNKYKRKDRKITIFYHDRNNWIGKINQQMIKLVGESLMRTSYLSDFKVLRCTLLINYSAFIVQKLSRYHLNQVLKWRARCVLMKLQAPLNTLRVSGPSPLGQLPRTQCPHTSEGLLDGNKVRPRGLQGQTTCHVKAGQFPPPGNGTVSDGSQVWPRPWTAAAPQKLDVS